MPVECTVAFKAGGSGPEARRGQCISDQYQATVALFDSTVRIWDASSGKQLDKLALDGLAEAMAFSPDSRWLATGTTEGRAILWSLTPP